MWIVGACVRRCDVCVIDVIVYVVLCWCLLVYCRIIACVIDDIITEGNLKALRCVCLHMC